MSQTVRIAGTLATDPINLNWSPIEAAFTNTQAGYILSRFRRVMLEFPVLTSAQWNQWAVVCDDGLPHTPTLYRRTDGSLVSNPENFTIGSDPFGNDFVSSYRYHMAGQRFSTGIYLYDARVLVYMVKSYSVHGGGG